jgi:hypothetical protein
MIQACLSLLYDDAAIAYIAIIAGKHEIRRYIAMMAMNFAANQSADSLSLRFGCGAT